MECKKQWQLPIPLHLSPELIAAAGDAVIAEILFRRGYQSPASMRQFMDMELYGPFDFSNHQLVVPLVHRIEQAINRGEQITVYGDYDVDGVTSTAVWVETLCQVGATVNYHVPDRFQEGYGINVAVLQQLAASGTKLIITCDCGISNFSEIALARDLGMDVLVTDHHELPEQLPAVPIFNPKMLPQEHPSYTLPGVGASYLVARELLKNFGQEPYAENLLELLALGIIADVVPLTKDNRWYLKQGLPRLLNSKRPGLKALLAVAKINPVYGTEEDIAFQVIPRLNAAGRLESARSAVELLICREETEARELAAKLDRLNETRKTLCERMMKDAVAQIYELPEPPAALVLYQENWPEGVVGVVAGRLAEQFGKPAFLMTRKENGIITGSARSVAGINVFQTLTACREVLDKFGGHEGAAGFSLGLENIAVFRQQIEQVISGLAGEAGITEALSVDATLPADRINIELYRRIRQLAPFGPDNPQPVFMVDGQITANQVMKDGSLHRRLRVAKNRTEIEGVWWHSASKHVSEQDWVVARVRLNFFRDVTVQLDVQDIVTAEDCLSPRPPHSLQLIDLRGNARDILQKTYPHAVFFGEGPDVQGALTRRELTPADTLVMLTIPPHWEEIRAAVGPQQIVIAWDQQSRNGDKALETTWLYLLGLIKYAVRMYEGCITTERAAAQLGLTGELVLAGMMALEEAGLLKLTAIDTQRVSVEIRQNELPNLCKLQGYRRFIKMLAELEAYRNYLRCLPVEKLSELLQGEDGESA
jgi:single-stranded-DNA-specific exonuclease